MLLGLKIRKIIYEDISEVYLKGSHLINLNIQVEMKYLIKQIDYWVKQWENCWKNVNHQKKKNILNIENGNKWMMKKQNIKTGICIFLIMLEKIIFYTLNMKYDAGKKLDLLDKAFMAHRMKKMIPSCFLPKLEGDKCTFIGSTFLELGEKEPYLNHMVVLSDEKVTTPEVENSEVVSKKTEKGLLRAWVKTIQQQDPDIIIGYNIFSFDWKFLIERAEELHILNDFLKMRSIKDEPDEI